MVAIIQLPGRQSYSPAPVFSDRDLAQRAAVTMDSPSFGLAPVLLGGATTAALGRNGGKVRPEAGSGAPDGRCTPRKVFEPGEADDQLRNQVAENTYRRCLSVALKSNLAIGTSSFRRHQLRYIANSARVSPIFHKPGVGSSFFSLELHVDESYL